MLLPCYHHFQCQNGVYIQFLFSISTSGVGKLICFVKLSFICSLEKLKLKQECILVGCVLPTAVADTGGSPHPPEQAPLEQAPHLEQAPPWSSPLDQVPPARSPSTTPLGVGLDQIPLNFPLGCGPGNLQGMLDTTPPGDLLQGMLGYHLQCMLG